jgi:hypothetical protein
MCTIGHSLGSACGTTHTKMGFSTLRVEPHLRSVRLRSSAPPSPASVNWSRRRVTAVMERMPVQRSREMNPRVRSSARFSSVAGLRARNASSPTIDAGTPHAARQSMANCSPLVQPRYSISFSQFCSSRSNWSDFRAPSAFNRVSFWGRSFSRVNALMSSLTSCATSTPKVFQDAK